MHSAIACSALLVEAQTQTSYCPSPRPQHPSFCRLPSTISVQLFIAISPSAKRALLHIHYTVRVITAVYTHELWLVLLIYLCQDTDEGEMLTHQCIAAVATGS